MQADEGLDDVSYVPIGGMEVEAPPSFRHETGESPTLADLFKGERRKWKPPVDLDRFFGRVYHYYCHRGFWCIVVQWLVELLTLGFTIAFSAFLLLAVNWHSLFNAKCGVQAAEEGLHPCSISEEAIHKEPFKVLSFGKAMVVGYLVVFTVYWLFCFVRFFPQLRDILEIRDFCHTCLGVDDHEIQTIAWPALVDRIVGLQARQRLCIVRDLTAHDIVSRIMRKENYLIGLLNKGGLAVLLPAWLWLPGSAAAPGEEEDVHGPARRQHLMLTKALEWSLTWCILHNMFDRNFLIKREFVDNPAALRKRLRVVGCGMLLLSPFLTIFVLIYFFLRNAEQFYHQPSTAGSRRWSDLARWKFREFNELEHMYKRRLDASYQHAAEYVKQFPSPIVSMLAKLVSFITGSFAAVLLAIALVEESLLEAHLWGRNLLWYGAVLGTVLAVSRSLVTEENSVLDPEGCMARVAHHTHYFPKHWRGAANTDRVRREFEAFFQLKAVLFLEEMVSIFVTPFLLWFCYPQCVDRILHFVQDFTVHVDGVGHVCSLSVFDFEHHGNSKYGSPFHASKEQRSSHGKMEKSFIGFKSNYPNWEPDEGGKQFLAVLADFQSKQAPGSGLLAEDSCALPAGHLSSSPACFGMPLPPPLARSTLGARSSHTNILDGTPGAALSEAACGAQARHQLADESIRDEATGGGCAHTQDPPLRAPPSQRNPGPHWDLESSMALPLAQSLPRYSYGDMYSGNAGGGGGGGGGGASTSRGWDARAVASRSRSSGEHEEPLWACQGEQEAPGSPPSSRSRRNAHMEPGSLRSHLSAPERRGSVGGRSDEEEAGYASLPAGTHPLSDPVLSDAAALSRRSMSESAYGGRESSFLGGHLEDSMAHMLESAGGSGMGQPQQHQQQQQGGGGGSRRGSPALINYEHVNQLYWLDRYYMSKSTGSMWGEMGEGARGRSILQSRLGPGGGASRMDRSSVHIQGMSGLGSGVASGLGLGPGLGPTRGWQGGVSRLYRGVRGDDAASSAALEASVEEQSEEVQGGQGQPRSVDQFDPRYDVATGGAPGGALQSPGRSAEQAPAGAWKGATSQSGEVERRGRQWLWRAGQSCQLSEPGQGSSAGHDDFLPDSLYEDHGRSHEHYESRRASHSQAASKREGGRLRPDTWRPEGARGRLADGGFGDSSLWSSSSVAREEGPRQSLVGLGPFGGARRPGSDTSDRGGRSPWKSDGVRSSFLDDKDVGQDKGRGDLSPGALGFGYRGAHTHRDERGGGEGPLMASSRSLPSSLARSGDDASGPASEGFGIALSDSHLESDVREQGGAAPPLSGARSRQSNTVNPFLEKDDSGSVWKREFPANGDSRSSDTPFLDDILAGPRT